MEQRLWNRFVETVADSRITNIIISQNGERIAEHHFDEEHRRNIYSATKSFTSAAVGIAVKEGLLFIEESVVDCFPDELPENVPENLQKLKLEHLLTMTVGQREAYLMGGQRPFLEEDDWVRYVLSKPFDYEPGTVYHYTNFGPYLLGVLISRRAGCSMNDYLTPRLFQPLGIRRTSWEVDPRGYNFGAGGLFLCTSEMLRFGELYLGEGTYKGRHILTPEWVRKSKTPYIRLENDPLGRDAFGYFFWTGPQGSYSANGKYGQYIIILDAQKAVIAINAESRQPMDFLRPLREMIIPAL